MPARRQELPVSRSFNGRTGAPPTCARSRLTLAVARPRADPLIEPFMSSLDPIRGTFFLFWNHEV